MYNPFRGKRAALLIGSLTLFTTPACTVVGYGLGSAIDPAIKRSRSVEALDPNVVAPGKKIDVHLTDGRRLQGISGGLERTPAPEYAEALSEASQSLRFSGSLPTPGDTVTVFTTSGPPIAGVFLGYDPDVVVLAAVNDTVTTPVGDLHELRFPGGRAGPADLRGVFDDPQIPFLSALRLERDEAASQLVPLRQVARVEWQPHTVRKTGMTLGGAIDVLLFLAFASFVESWQQR